MKTTRKMKKIKRLRFFNDGIESIDLKINKTDLKNFSKNIFSKINFKNLFLSKTKFLKLKSHKGVNPRPGRNLAEKIDTDHIFSNKYLIEKLNKVLGKNWRVLDYKFVVGMPDQFIPLWVQKECNNMAAPNLGAFLKYKNQNCTFFRGIDFHQDIIDYPGRNPDFVTLYLYLTDVTKNDAPIIVLRKSHKLLNQVFPHKLKKNMKKENSYIFEYKNKKIINLDKITITGKAGNTYFWHPFLLHGTSNCKSKKPRISLRILFDKNSHINKNSQLDKVNLGIKYKSSSLITRIDKDKNDKLFLRKNIIQSES
jgi:hypothetical protein